jgi:hypothetical protein
MRKFTELDDILKLPLSVDAWSDHTAGVARDLLGELTDGDWDALARSWRARPPEWQRRLAQVLPFGAPERALPIIAAMLASDDADVVITAADGLRDFGPEGAAEVVSPEIRAKLASLAEARGGLEATVIRELLKMTSPGR